MNDVLTVVFEPIDGGTSLRWQHVRTALDALEDALSRIAETITVPSSDHRGVKRRAYIEVVGSPSPGSLRVPVRVENDERFQLNMERLATALERQAELLAPNPRDRINRIADAIVGTVVAGVVTAVLVTAINPPKNEEHRPAEDELAMLCAQAYEIPLRTITEKLALALEEAGCSSVRFQLRDLPTATIELKSRQI